MKHKYFHEQERNKTNEKNNSSINNNSTSQIHLHKKNKTSHTRKARSVPDSSSNNQRDNTEGDGLFHPDTQLVDYAKILKKYQTTRPPAEGDVQSTDNLISMDEAKKLNKIIPVKPLDITFHLPRPVVPESDSPHGFGVRNGTYNYESRKLFERPKDFGKKKSEFLMTYNEKSNTNKSVKKDLSRYLSSIG